MKHPPIIESFYPHFGLAQGGTVVKVIGKHLGTTRNDIRCIYPKRHPNCEWKILEFVSPSEIICESSKIELDIYRNQIHNNSYSTEIILVTKSGGHSYSNVQFSWTCRESKLHAQLNPIILDKMIPNFDKKKTRKKGNTIT